MPSPPEPPAYDASTAEVNVYVYKSGLLSAFGHNLKMRCGSFRILTQNNNPDKVQYATFDASSLQVVGRFTDIANLPHQRKTQPVSEEDKAAIEANTFSSAVLNTNLFKEISFRTLLQTTERVEGNLLLLGVSRYVKCTRERTMECDRVTCPIDVTQFGMRPFSSFLGALKVQPVVDVEVVIPRRK